MFICFTALVSATLLWAHAVISAQDVFEKHADTFEKLGVNANNGLGFLELKLARIAGV